MLVYIVFVFVQSITAFQLTNRSIEESVQIVHIDAVKMDYSIKQFSVKSGGLVEIHFSNKDVIRHNLLIIAPGSLEKVGKMADLMATTPDGVKKEWVPETPEVLFYTPLVSVGDKYILKFTAPVKKGKYPFVCTFPTHWRMMNGEMIVE